MQRRTLLKLAPASLALSAPAWLRAQTAAPAVPAGWREFEVATDIDIKMPSGATRVWVPLPLAQETGYFKTLSNTWTGNAEKVEFLRDPVYGAAMAVATFKAGEAEPRLVVNSRFATRERAVGLAPGAGDAASPEELALALKPTEFMPTDGIVKKTALEVTRGAKTDVQKARAIYDWVVENTFRDPKTRGCGQGDVKTMLETGALSGKCADLNALFVALCRAVGVPARDVYGVRVAASPRGYKSMGKPGDITKAQHCRAEFYAQGIGWVPVDPADVRKVILEEKPGLTLNDPEVKAMRDFLFGNWEGNWMAYNTGHDIKLPGSKGAPVAFLMYPQAEDAEGRRDSLDPDNFRYRISSREVGA